MPPLPTGPYFDPAAFCRRRSIRMLARFGLVLREDFRPDSDVDVLVEAESEAHCWLLALVRMQSELERCICQKVNFRPNCISRCVSTPLISPNVESVTVVSTPVNDGWFRILKKSARNW